MSLYGTIGALLGILLVYLGLRWAAWEAIKQEEKERGVWPNL